MREKRALVGIMESRLIQILLPWGSWWWKLAARAGGVWDSGTHLGREQQEKMVCGQRDTPVIQAVRRWRQEDHEFKFSLGYVVVSQQD